MLISCGQRTGQEAQSPKEETEKTAEIERITPIVTAFIDKVKAGKEELCKYIDYPFYRDYPIPPITNKEEFLRRYDEIFDETLLKMIVNSDIATDWCEMGVKGIMLGNGDVWISENGELIGINYQSETEKKRREEIIQIDKNSVHKSLKEFESLVWIMETDKYKIRIDDLGNDNFRYASWKVGNSMKNKPDVILTNGILRVEGSAGNQIYSFANGNFVYQCCIWSYDDNRLIIYKDAQLDESGLLSGFGTTTGTEILNQVLKFVYYPFY